MKPRISHASILAVLLLAASAPLSLAVTQEEAVTGRALAKKYADAIVSVEVVATIKVTVGEHAQPPRESKLEENGTVISPTGLTVTVLSTIDPRGAMESMISSRGLAGQNIEIGETEFKDVKLRLADNTEVPAVIVLKDPDLNLVFVAPVGDSAAAKRTFPFISLDKSTTGEVLGNYYFVTRASKSLQRVPIIRTATIVGIVDKPRRLYLMSDQAPGVPVFDPAGLVLGISIQYLENRRPGSHVVLTAADIAELATQAAAVKPDDKEEKETAAAEGEVSPTPTAQPAAKP